MLRPVPRCLYGTNLATAADFEKQHDKAKAVIAHWQTYVKIFTRLNKGPLIIGDICCSEGGQSMGIVAIDAEVRGLDNSDQPQWRQQFGDEHFTRGDACKSEDVAKLGRCHGFVCSPPCQGGSSMPHAGGGLTDWVNF